MTTCAALCGRGALAGGLRIGAAPRIGPGAIFRRARPQLPAEQRPPALGPGAAERTARAARAPRLTSAQAGPDAGARSATAAARCCKNRPPARENLPRPARRQPGGGVFSDKLSPSNEVTRDL